MKEWMEGTTDTRRDMERVSGGIVREDEYER